MTSRLLRDAQRSQLDDRSVIATLEHQWQHASSDYLAIGDDWRISVASLSRAPLFDPLTRRFNRDVIDDEVRAVRKARHQVQLTSRSGEELKQNVASAFDSRNRILAHAQALG